ncbi:uridine 5'-monophosphate synthase [Orussus abietinus]|uniref:uridine 5'-monophosphate synthase n=1 Tax=Orussus abietinus TaxID=222816 RepID=UPI000625F651|nr:uridine 5'-monophosphate synthase [Orussus abietinus]
MELELKELAIALYDINAVKFGDFVTKAGLKTPIYFDLRVIIAHPKLMQRLSKSLWKLHTQKSKSIAQICGVPYTALPLATLISTENDIPMLIRRKEAKAYGTKKLIEGKYSDGDPCIIIEDVITTGSSVLETAKDLKEAGLTITEALVIVDREQGGWRNLKRNGIVVKSLYTISQLMEYLLEAGKVTSVDVKNVAEYLKMCKAPVLVEKKEKSRLSMNFLRRAAESKNPVASKLFRLMSSKETTLCLAADLTTTNSILELANLAGPHIAVLKIHVDIVEDFTKDFTKQLRQLAEKHDFLLMEDRKFGDIGHTVSLQYQKGVYRIAEWADFVTVHPIAGPKIISGLETALDGISEHRGFFLVCEMSSEGALTTEDYIRRAVSMAKCSETIVGVVSQSEVISDPGLIQLTPGVRLSETSDSLGQRYNTPATVVASGADLVVVGRGITEANDKLAAILRYKEALWQAYKKRINDS